MGGLCAVILLPCADGRTKQKMPQNRAAARALDDTSLRLRGSNPEALQPLSQRAEKRSSTSRLNWFQDSLTLGFCKSFVHRRRPRPGKSCKPTVRWRRRAGAPLLSGFGLLRFGVCRSRLLRHVLDEPVIGRGEQCLGAADVTQHSVFGPR